MADFEFQIIEDNTELVKKAAKEAIERALEDVGLEAEGDVKLITPVRTSRLKNSITHVVEPDEDAVYVGTNVEYAPHVEYGTSRQRAKPYLKPAIEKNLKKYAEIVKSFLEEAIED